jgi:hypothetical protein
VITNQDPDNIELTYPGLGKVRLREICETGKASEEWFGVRVNRLYGGKTKMCLSTELAM